VNTSCDFLSFVVGAVQMGFLVSGDVLICDNAKVHTAPLMTMHLKAFLAAEYLLALLTDLFSRTESRAN
jgi:hypothetical protein